MSWFQFGALLALGSSLGLDLLPRSHGHRSAYALVKLVAYTVLLVEFASWFWIAVQAVPPGTQ